MLISLGWPRWKLQEGMLRKAILTLLVTQAVKEFTTASHDSQPHDASVCCHYKQAL